MDKKRIFVILIIIALALSACFSPWKGDEGAFSIHIGSDTDGRAAGWLNKDIIPHLEHTITLSYGLGLEQTQKNVKYGETVKFSVIPGYWNITITAFLNGEKYAEGSRDVKIEPGPNGAIAIKMEPVKQVEPPVVPPEPPIPPEPPAPPEPPVEPVEPPESVTYTVTFMVDDIRAYSTSVLSGETISALEVLYINKLIHDMDDFIGWYTDPVEGEEWDITSTIVTSDITLYARWDVPGVTVDVAFEITFKQIQGIEPLPIGTITLNPISSPITLTVQGSYNSINWYINGTTGKGPSFTLKHANLSLGEHYLTVEVVTHDGEYYSQTITITVIN